MRTIVASITRWDIVWLTAISACTANGCWRSPCRKSPGPPTASAIRCWQWCYWPRTRRRRSFLTAAVVAFALELPAYNSSSSS